MSGQNCAQKVCRAIAQISRTFGMWCHTQVVQVHFSVKLRASKPVDGRPAKTGGKLEGAAEGQRAIRVASPDGDIDTVDAETDETPVRSFKVSRNHQGKLFLDGIKEALANGGLVLLGIGEDAFPAHKDGWTIQTFNTSPVQLIVGRKPGLRFKQAVAYPNQQTFLKQIWQSSVA
ncbi:hypothetical protein ABBQ32_008775 [Trebouxia sp. C0010 RCD-2024]